MKVGQCADGFFYGMFIYVVLSSLLVVCPVVLLMLREFHSHNFMIISLRDSFFTVHNSTLLN